MIKKVVQGTYIDLEVKEVLRKEAARKGIPLTRLVSEIVERGARRISNKEAKVEDSQRNLAADAM